MCFAQSREPSYLVGSVDTVVRQLEVLLKRMPYAEWIFGWMFNGLVANDVNLKSLELYATKVLPRLGLGHPGA